MRILLTNDDGIRSPGIKFLIDVASEFGEVIAVAPDRDQSGIGQAISLTRPLRLFQTSQDKRLYGLSGTPTDCIYVGVNHVMKDIAPDVVLSGINTGANLGWDVHYSGTAAGAREGTLQGLPSIAFSLLPSSEGFPWEDIRPWVRLGIERFLKHPPAEHTFYNVNIPNPHTTPIQGMQAASLGQRIYAKDVFARNDPRGREYLWLGGDQVHMPDIPGSDCNLVKSGYVAVTPIRCDVTDVASLGHMGHWSSEP